MNGSVLIAHVSLLLAEQTADTKSPLGGGQRTAKAACAAASDPSVSRRLLRVSLSLIIVDSCFWLMCERWYYNYKGCTGGGNLLHDVEFALNFLVKLTMRKKQTAEQAAAMANAYFKGRCIARVPDFGNRVTFDIEGVASVDAVGEQVFCVGAFRGLSRF